MRVVIAAALAAVTLAGCSGTGTGNSAGINYTMVGNLNIGSATADADRHCAKYGKVSQLSDTGNLMASFKCVEP